MRRHYNSVSLWPCIFSRQKITGSQRGSKRRRGKCEYWNGWRGREVDVKRQSERVGEGERGGGRAGVRGGAGVWGGGAPGSQGKRNGQLREAHGKRQQPGERSCEPPT